MFGFASIAIALYHMTGFDLQMSFGYASLLRFYQSIGLPFLFVPINTLAYVGIPPGKNNDVSGLTNLARNIGGSCGNFVLHHNAGSPQPGASAVPGEACL